MSADREIAVIAEIARNHRNLKGKTLPLSNTDYADLKREKTYRGFTRMSADQEIARNATLPALYSSRRAVIVCLSHLQDEI